MEFWKRGQRSELARLSKNSRCTLSNILYRRIEISKDKALRLAKASEAMGLNISILDWLYNKTTKHPAFFDELYHERTGHKKRGRKTKKEKEENKNELDLLS
jgi:transcriptional regulator with XRE-family HTH domain